MSKQLYTGELKRGPLPDTVVGELVDAWGWRIRIEGARDPSGGYRLVGTIDGAVPKTLRQPAIDGGADDPVA